MAKLLLVVAQIQVLKSTMDFMDPFLGAGWREEEILEEDRL